MFSDGEISDGVDRKEGRISMADWIIYVVVGLAVGMNLGYMVGIRRGTMIVSELISGIVEAIDGKG